MATQSFFANNVPTLNWEIAEQPVQTVFNGNIVTIDGHKALARNDHALYDNTKEI